MREDPVYYYNVIFGPVVLTLAAVTFVSNVMLCLLVLTSRPLRQTIRYWFIVGIAISDILTAVVACLWIAAKYRSFIHTCGSVAILTAYYGYAMEFINWWYLVLLTSDYCVRMSRRRLPELSPLGIFLAKMSLTSLPWLGCVVVICVGAAFGLGWQRDHCVILFTFNVHVVVKVIAFTLPAVITLVTLVYMQYKRLTRNRVGNYVSMGDDDDPATLSPVCYTVVFVLTLFCYGWSELLDFWIVHIRSLDTIIIIHYITGIILVLKAALLPYIWLIMTDLRSQVKNKLSRNLEIGHASYRRFPQQHDSGEVTVSHSEDE